MSSRSRLDFRAVEEAIAVSRKLKPARIAVPAVALAGAAAVVMVMALKGLGRIEETKTELRTDVHLSPQLSAIGPARKCGRSSVIRPRPGRTSRGFSINSALTIFSSSRERMSGHSAKISLVSLPTRMPPICLIPGSLSRNGWWRPSGSSWKRNIPATRLT